MAAPHVQAYSYLALRSSVLFFWFPILAARLRQGILRPSPSCLPTVRRPLQAPPSKIPSNVAASWISLLGTSARNNTPYRKQRPWLHYRAVRSVSNRPFRQSTASERAWSCLHRHSA